MTVCLNLSPHLIIQKCLDICISSLQNITVVLLFLQTKHIQNVEQKTFNKIFKTLNTVFGCHDNKSVVNCFNLQKKKQFSNVLLFICHRSFLPDTCHIYTRKQNIKCYSIFYEMKINRYVNNTNYDNIFPNEYKQILKTLQLNKSHGSQIQPLFIHFYEFG